MRTLAFLISLMSITALTLPEVFFADDAHYQQAYLMHQLDGANIRFKMSKDTVAFQLPAQSFDRDALVAFANNEYVFANGAFKADFSKMFRMTIESKHNTIEFLTEFKQLLDRFAELYPHHVQQ